MNLLKNFKLKKKYFGYIEGIIYILFTLVVVFTNIAGPIEIRLLPFVFILGIVGRTIFNRPFLTSVFGFLISICAIYMVSAYSFTYNLMYSLFCFICILIGEVEGMYIIKIMSKKSIFKNNSKNITLFILLALAGIYLNNYVNGNIFTYFKVKQAVKDYITVNYPNSNNAIITDGKYVFNKYKYYSFNVKNIDISDSKTYNFAVYSNDKVIDGYEESRLKSNSRLLKSELVNKINLNKYNNFNFDIEYTDLKNSITVYITKSVNKINLYELNIFTEDVNNILDDLTAFDKFNNISKIDICIKDEMNKSNAEIYSTNFYDKEYYLGSLQTEYLDN